MAKGIKDLHKINIVHKEIKPGNILINPDDGRIKITNFGIATLSTTRTESAIRVFGLDGTLISGRTSTRWAPPSTKCSRAGPPLF